VSREGERSSDQAMELAMVAIDPLLPKLGELLAGEFTLEKRVRKGVESLVTELKLMHAALRKVAKVQPEQLDEGVKIWAAMVRDLAYQMENIIDTFMIRVEDGAESTGPRVNIVKKLLKKATMLFKNAKDLHQIFDALEETVDHAKHLAELRQRYEREMCDANIGTTIDPRITSLYTDVTELVGIDEKREELVEMLLQGDNWLQHPLKTVSIVGFGGLGKTTLAKAAYENIKLQFECDAFVSVSRNPDMKKVFKDILYDLDKEKYIHNATRDEKQLIDELIEFLKNKRYFFLVIDEIFFH
jgi:DNA-directed RNA polymerase subunit F